MKHENRYGLISRFDSLGWYVAVKKWAKAALTPTHFFPRYDPPWIKKTVEVRTCRLLMTFIVNSWMD